MLKEIAAAIKELFYVVEGIRQTVNGELNSNIQRVHRYTEVCTSKASFGISSDSSFLLLSCTLLQWLLCQENIFQSERMGGIKTKDTGFGSVSPHSASSFSLFSKKRLQKWYFCSTKKVIVPQHFIQLATIHSTFSSKVII